MGQKRAQHPGAAFPHGTAGPGRAGQGSSRPLGPAVSTATRGQRAGAGGRGQREEAEEKGRAGQGRTGRRKGEGSGAGCRGGGLVDMRGASPRRPGGQRRASGGGGAAHTSPPCAGLQMCGGDREAGGEPPSSPPCLQPCLPPASSPGPVKAEGGQRRARQPAAQQPCPGQQVSSGFGRSARLPPGAGGLGGQLKRINFKMRVLAKI